MRWVGPFLGTVMCAGLATAGPEQVTTVQVDGRHDVRGRYHATLTLTPRPDGLLVERRATFADGATQVHVGRGAWAGDQLTLTLYPPRAKAGAACTLQALRSTVPVTQASGAGDRLELRLVLDSDSGFGVERSADAEGSGRGIARLQKTPPAPSVARRSKLDDLTGWPIKVPGQVRHAVRKGQRVYVAAGTAGLVVVDLEREAVARAVALPGVARRVLVVGPRAWVLASVGPRTRIHLVDLTRGRRLRSVTCPGATALVAVGKQVAAVAPGVVRLLDAAGRVRVSIGVAGQGAPAQVVSAAKGQLLLPLGRGGLARIATPSRRAAVIPTRETIHDVVQIGETAYVVGAAGLSAVDLRKRTCRALGRAGVVRLFARGRRLFALTRTALLELDLQGRLVAERKLGVTLPPAPDGEYWIVDARAGSAILALRGVGLVVLEL